MIRGILGVLAAVARASLPFAMLGIFGATLWKCAQLMKEHGHWDKWVRAGDLPIISTLGAEQPERTTFVRGFTLLAIGLAFATVIRHRQLGRELALRESKRSRWLTTIFGVMAAVALIAMAWLPATETPHFLAALATFALLAASQALHTGLCLALRNAPSDLPRWPGRLLAAWLLLCPALSISCVVFWVERGSSRFQFAAVGLQFAYFLALAPAFARNRPRSTGPLAVASPSQALSFAVVHAAVWFAVLSITAHADRFDNDEPCEQPTYCYASRSDFVECRTKALGDDLRLHDSNRVYDAFCPGPAGLFRTSIVPAVRRVGLPLAWLLGCGAVLIAFFERSRRVDERPRRAWLVRSGFGLAALAVPYMAYLLAQHSQINASVSVANAIPIIAAIVVAWLMTALRADRMLRGKSIRGFQAPIVFVLAAIALGLAVGTEQLARAIDQHDTASWRSLDFRGREASSAYFALRTLKGPDYALVLAMLPLTMISVLTVFRDRHSRYPEAWSRPFRATAGVAVALAIGTRLPVLRVLEQWNPFAFVSLVPLAIIALAIFVRLRLGETTRFTLGLTLVVTDGASILLHVRRWVDDTSGFVELHAHALARFQAMRWAELAVVVDLVLVAIWLAATARRERNEPDGVSDDRRALAVTLAASALLFAFAGVSFYAMDAPAAAIERSFRRIARSVDGIPEVAAAQDASLAALYRVGRDGQVRFIESDSDNPEPRTAIPPPPPGFWVAAADRTLTLAALERALAPHGSLTSGIRLMVSLSPHADREKIPPHATAFGIRRSSATPVRFGTFPVSLFVSRERWENPTTPVFVLTESNGALALFERSRSDRKVTLTRANDRNARELVCPGNSGSDPGYMSSRRDRGPELVIAADDDESLESLARRLSTVEKALGREDPAERACAIGSYLVTRDREAFGRLAR